MAIQNLYPSIKPSLNLDFANTKTIDTRITFTRASTATYFDEFGMMRTVPANSPRIDFDPVTGECKGLLIEEQRTNLLTYSEQFGNEAWAEIRSSITENAAVAPDGKLTADKLVEDTTDKATHYARSGGTLTADTVYTVSVFAKAAERTNFYIGFGTSTGWVASGGAVFDLQTGNCRSSNAAVVADMTPIGGGWYHCIATTKSATTGTATFDLTLLDTYIGTGLYDGDGTSGIYIWGAQLEAGTFPTSYIPTTSSQVTRAADSASMTGANFSSWYRQDEGALFAEWSVKDGVVGNRGPWWINNGTNVRGIGVYHISSTAVRLMYRDSTGASLETPSFGGITYPYTMRTAAAFSNSSLSLSVSGNSPVTQSSDTVSVFPATSLNIGEYRASGANVGHINGHIRRLAYYPKALTATNLQALAT